MRFMVEYPILSDADGGAWIDPDNIAEFARTAEAVGVDAISLTDHPAPSAKWLEHGGHETLDPFVGLMYVASVTTTLQVMTHLAVLPYRNPFLTAKSIATLDLLSGGRTTFTLGTGYLRSEFAALGVDFAERNEIFDEAVEVMKAAWTGEEVRFEGRHFAAYGVRHSPRPRQRPHPPLWLGGNATVVRQRLAAWGDGWAPLLGSPELIRTTRTPGIAGSADLARLIAEVRERRAQAGRDPEFDVACGLPERLPTRASDEQRLDALGRLSEIGVTWTQPPVPRTSFRAAIDGLQAAAGLMAKLR